MTSQSEHFNQITLNLKDAQEAKALTEGQYKQVLKQMLCAIVMNFLTALLFIIPAVIKYTNGENAETEIWETSEIIATNLLYVWFWAISKRCQNSIRGLASVSHFMSAAIIVTYRVKFFSSLTEEEANDLETSQIPFYYLMTIRTIISIVCFMNDWFTGLTWNAIIILVDIVATTLIPAFGNKALLTAGAQQIIIMSWCMLAMRHYFLFQAQNFVVHQKQRRLKTQLEDILHDCADSRMIYDMAEAGMDEDKAIKYGAPKQDRYIASLLFGNENVDAIKLQELAAKMSINFMNWRFTRIFQCRPDQIIKDHTEWFGKKIFQPIHRDSLLDQNQEYEPSMKETYQGKGDFDESKKLCLLELLSQKESDPDALNMLYVVKHQALIEASGLNPRTETENQDTMDSNSTPTEYVFSLHILEVFYNDRNVKMLVLRDQGILFRAKKMFAFSKKLKQFTIKLAEDARMQFSTIAQMSTSLLEQEHLSEKRHLLQVMQVSSQIKASSVRDLLDLAMIQKSGYRSITTQLESFNVRQAVEEVIKLMLPAAGHKRIEILHKFCRNLPKYIRCDKSRIQQMLVNYMNNSVKFTPKGGEIRIRVEFLPDLDELKVEVEDSGSGIEDQLLCKGQQLFDQAATNGIGFGLHVVYKLAKALGGSVGCKSGGTNQGAAFNFTVRAKRSTRPVAENFKIRMIPIYPDSKASEPKIFDPNAEEVELDYSEIGSGNATVEAKIKPIDNNWSNSGDQDSGPVLQMKKANTGLTKKQNMDALSLGNVKFIHEGSQKVRSESLQEQNDNESVFIRGTIEQDIGVFKLSTRLDQIEIDAQLIMDDEEKKDGKIGKILVVDSNMMTQLSIQSLLEVKFKLKNQVTYCSESSLAVQTILKALQQSTQSNYVPYDLIIIDQNMPQKSGLNVMAEIREAYLCENKQDSLPYFVLLSGEQHNQSLRKRAKEQGIDEFQSQPIGKQGMRKILVKTGFVEDREDTEAVLL